MTNEEFVEQFEQLWKEYLAGKSEREALKALNVVCSQAIISIPDVPPFMVAAFFIDLRQELMDSFD